MDHEGLNKTRVEGAIKTGGADRKRRGECSGDGRLERDSDVEDVEDGDFDIDIGNADGTANNGGTDLKKKRDRCDSCAQTAVGVGKDEGRES